MSKEFDSTSQEVINFRPKIEFVEPEQEEVQLPPTPEPAPTISSVNEQRHQIQKLAETIDILAELVQERIDAQCKDMKIKLYSPVDDATIDAMYRRFPGWEPPYITFPQYKKAREAIMNYGLEVAEQAKPKAREANETDGSARPELNPNSQIIKPINNKKFQNEIIKILANWLFEMIIIKPMKPVLGIGMILEGIFKNKESGMIEIFPLSDEWRPILVALKKGGGAILGQ